jgi:Kef-type K+ transport system membrane component KefB
MKISVGWTLLALSVALVNAGSGVTALYILLACIGWAIFLLFPVKFVLKWIAKKTGSSLLFRLHFQCFESHHWIYLVETGPSVFFMTVTMMILFGSAFFTDVIGVHAIFGMLRAHICALNYPL